MDKKPTYGLILAGGKSSRMGTNKALLQLHDGTTQIEHLMQKLNPVCDQVFLSQRLDQDLPKPTNLGIIHDSIKDIFGPLCGILSAMETHPKVDWLVVACDLPNIKTEMLQYLKEQFQKLSQPHFMAYKSSTDQLPEPLCAIYPSGSNKTLMRRAKELNKFCPRKMLIIEKAHLIEQLHPRSLDNLNTPEDLKNHLDLL